jgi:hypothetical protein
MEMIGRYAMTSLFRSKEGLSIPMLAPAWALELAKGGGDPNQYEQDLVHILVEDIINGRLDDTGPERNGRRLGLRLELNGRPCFIEGRELRDLICCPIPAISLHRIVVMKEAALDFARRREVPAPSWWTEGPGLSPASCVTSPNAHSGAASPTSSPFTSTRRGGRRPKKLDQAKEAMRGDIREGRLTLVKLRDMLEKNLAEKYEVSRDTARKARDAVLSEVPPPSETQFLQ